MEDFQTGMPARDVTKQIADIVVGNTLTHYGGVHTIPTIGDPEYGIPKKFILTYGAVSEFTCKDFQPVHISVPAGRQLIVFCASYGSTSHPDHDVTQAVIKNLVNENAIDHEGGVHTAIGDPEPGVPKTFRLVYGYSQMFSCFDFQPVVVSVEEGLSLHVFRATYGSANVYNTEPGDLEAQVPFAPPAKDVTKQIADIVVNNKLVHYGGVHTIPTIGDPEPGVLKKFILSCGVVMKFACKDFEPVRISVPAGRQLIVFSASYGSDSHSDNDVTQAVIEYLGNDNAIDHEGGVHTAIGDPEPGVPKTFRIVYGYSQRFTCLDFQPVNISVESGLSLHVFRATYGSANLK